MSGGEKQRDPLLFPYMGLTSKMRRSTLQPGFISFPGAAADNKRPVNMRPEAAKFWYAPLRFAAKKRLAAGLEINKAKAAKKKEAPISHHQDAPPKFGNSRRFFRLLFLSAASPFFMAIVTSEGVRLFHFSRRLV